MRPRIHVWAWFFRLPWWPGPPWTTRGFDGFCLTPWDVIVRPGYELDRWLLCHEHQHARQWCAHPLAFPLSYWRYGYTDNPYEVEANDMADACMEWCHEIHKPECPMAVYNGF